MHTYTVVSLVFHDLFEYIKSDFFMQNEKSVAI